MIYRKNVPVWERVLRVAFGLALAAYAFSIWGSLLSFVLVASGVGVAMTGFVGFCPMCALAGRRLDKASAGQGER